MIDVAALTLEDQFPELSSNQVRDILDRSQGDLRLATQLCRDELSCGDGSVQDSSPAGTSKEEYIDTFLDSVVNNCEARAPQPEYRHWWPAAPSGVSEEQQRLKMSVSFSTRPFTVNSVKPAASEAPRLQPERPHYQSVRVLQRHSTSSPAIGPERSVGSLISSSEQGLTDTVTSAAARSTGSTQGVHYAAVFLTEESKDRVLHSAPPLHEAVSADHMTLAYRPTLDQCLELPLGRQAALFVEGVVSDYRAQALAVQHPSWLPFYSESVPHVTVSVGEGVLAREAGDLVKAGQQGAGPRVVPLVGMKLLHGTVGVKLDDGSVAYSQAELQEGLERMENKPPTLDQSAPIRILKRGQRPVAQQPTPPAQAAPVTQHQQATPLGHMAQGTQPRTPSAPQPSAAAATPSLDELLDMLHLEDTTSAASKGTPQTCARQQKGTPQVQHRSGPHALSASPGCMPAQGQQKREERARRVVPQLLSKHRPAARAQQPQLQQHFKAGHSPVDSHKQSSMNGHAPGGGDHGDAGQDLLSALAERLGAGAGLAPTKHHVVQGGKGNAAPAVQSSCSISHSPQPPLLPPSQRLQQGALPRHAAPAPARTLADFLPADLAAPDPQLPLPFFLDSDNTPTPVPQQQQQYLHIEKQSSAAGSLGGYESSSSSMAGEADANSAAPAWQQLATAYGAGVITADDLRQAFPDLEADVLEAALQMHGGDASEAASFLAALNMHPEEGGAHQGGEAGSISSSSSRQQRAAPATTIQSHSKLWAGGRKGAGGRGGSGGRASGHGWKQKGHTGASDPIAVAERQAMSLHFAAKNMYEQAARAAAARGAYVLSRELSASSQRHGEQAQAARRRANSTAYRTSNRSVTNTFKLDLHGLHVEEALQVLERHLVSLGGLGHPGGIVLEVVTGLGRHSSAGQPRLLPAVVRFLSDAGYRFDTQEGNSGLINVFIGC